MPFEISQIIGNSGTYITAETYGFDIDQLAFSIRIAQLTGLTPSKEDTNYLLPKMHDDNLTLIGQNTLITNYMTTKYPANVPG